MSYTHEWVNRFETENSVEIDLNLTDENGNFSRINRNWPLTPKEVDDAFLQADADELIARLEKEDAARTTKAETIEAVKSVDFFTINDATLVQIIAEQQLTITAEELKKQLAGVIQQANAAAAAVFGDVTVADKADAAVAVVVP